MTWFLLSTRRKVENDDSSCLSTWLKPRISRDDLDPPREHFNKDIRIKLTLTTDQEDSWETISLFSLEINCIGVCSIAQQDPNSGFGGKVSCQVNPGLAGLKLPQSMLPSGSSRQELERWTALGRVQMHLFDHLNLTVNCDGLLGWRRGFWMKSNDDDDFPYQLQILRFR